jgi:hypothetical protein
MTYKIAHTHEESYYNIFRKTLCGWAILHSSYSLKEAQEWVHHVKVHGETKEWLIEDKPSD